VSRESVEIIKRWLGSFDGDTEIFRSTLHPDIEWLPFEDNHTPSRGIDGAMRIRNGWNDAWEEMQIELEEVLDIDDCVVVSMHVTSRGKSSGAEVDTRLHLLFRVRDEKIIYIFEHTDRAAALEAAGLSAETSGSR
jgi:ketosteroid isomerase-like protein